MILPSRFQTLLCLLLASSLCRAQQVLHTEVLVVGGGTGGTAAGIQSARMGVHTVIVEQGPWLGGMLSSAGVSATDGNHLLPSGIWEEFRQQLYKVYGGPAALASGWVSFSQFEPHVADSIFKTMAARTPALTVKYGWQFIKTLRQGDRITGALFKNTSGQTLQIRAPVTIDATELGDVMASANVPYDLGMEASSMTGEPVIIPQTNHVVQDLTYVAVLKDYGPRADCTIAKPAGYRPQEFDGACLDYYTGKALPAPKVDSKKMLEYGRLPHNKYMLNWPLKGNDVYLNVVEMSQTEREQKLKQAKETTRRFIYFIQHDLGYKNLGLTDDEFPTADRLAIIPYYREGRRLKGVVRLMFQDVANPYAAPNPLYRTGIAVGDYPIDHHHKKNPSAPQHLAFYPVPSFTVPLGTLIPQKAEGLIVAEKGISVSNVVNGTTRLQPCVLLTGQAAGTLAALAIQRKTDIRKVSPRAVQAALLQCGAYLMPFVDVPKTDPAFIAIQKIGATGILKGRGIPEKWENKTFFYPDSLVAEQELNRALSTYYPKVSGVSATERPCTLDYLTRLMQMVRPGIKRQQISDAVRNWATTEPIHDNTPVTRRMSALLLNRFLDPFTITTNLKGHINE